MVPWVKVCPECGSKDVTPRGAISRSGYSPNYICQQCGFQSPLFPEVSPREAKKIRASRKNFVPAQMPIFAPKYGKPRKTKAAVIVGVVLLILLMLLLL